jgi:hypothetical protein
MACDEAHAGEVYGIADLPYGASEDYPEESELLGASEGICTERFSDYVGEPYATSDLEIYYFYPLPDGWSAGDRQVVCVAIDPSGQLGSSVENGNG